MYSAFYSVISVFLIALFVLPQEGAELHLLPLPLGEVPSACEAERVISFAPPYPLSHGCAVPALHLRRKFDLAKSKIWNLIYQRESQDIGFSAYKKLE